MIAMTSDTPIREKQILLAPYTLKRYTENNVIPKGAVEIKVIDFPFDADPQKMAHQALQYHPDIVALSFYVWNYLELMKCAEILKTEENRLLIVAGGPMVSFNAEEVMKEHPYIDVTSYDDTHGEIVFQGLIQSLLDRKSMEEASGVVYRSSDKLIKTKKVEGNIDHSVESSPFINNDIVLDDKQGYYVTIETSRGCPFDCGYCIWGSSRKKMEYFPMERVLKEIELIYNNPNVKHLLFVDSNMLLNKRRAIQIVQHIKKQKYYKSISTRMHLYITSMDEESAKILSTLPNFSFDFGLQTTNPDALTLISKHRATANQFEKKIGLMRKWVPELKFGIDLMIGLPGDSLDAFKKTLDFCFSIEPYRFFMAYPISLFPGTRFYEERDKLKLNYWHSHPQCILETDNFPRQDIQEAVRLATWTQILTYYYPAISNFFYSVCKEEFDSARFWLMERWINLIDSKVNLFRHVNFAEFRENPVKEWYVQKGNLLEYASSAQVAYMIYSTIYELHKSNKPAFERNIGLGFKVFSYYLEDNLNPIGQAALNSLPRELYEKYTEDEIREVHSIFKR
jgi:radical SAM superfamily enzyme YgiQ (UPF0313 family)